MTQMLKLMDEKVKVPVMTMFKDLEENMEWTDK